MKKLMLLITMCIIMQSCYVSKKTTSNNDEAQFLSKMEYFVGKTENELLLAWGSPTSTNSDGNNGRLLTFEQLKRGYIGPLGYVTYIHKYMFFIDSSGIIYSWKYNREGRQGF